MSNERDEEQQGESKIKIVDRRMLNDDERAGKVAVSSAPEAGATPKLEIVGGSSAQTNPNEIPDEPVQPQQPPVREPDGGDGGAPIQEPEDEEPISAEELQAMREEVEAEQFAAIEQQMGRALTEDEKVRVRQEMEKEAQSMASLEVVPVLHRTMVELSQRAAVHMGLMPNPYTRLIAKNEIEARLAIDAFGAIYEVMKPQLEPALQREYARVLNDLRINYSTQTGINLNTTGASGKSSLIIH